MKLIPRKKKTTGTRLKLLTSKSLLTRLPILVAQIKAGNNLNKLKKLNLLLINCEIKIDLSWSKECIISEISIIPRIPGNQNANPPVQEVAAIQNTAATFPINNAKLYIPVVTLSINDNTNFLENIKQGFKRTII